MPIRSSTVAAAPTVQAAATPKAPPLPARTRLALLVFVAVYPLVTALLYVIVPLTDGWQTWQRTLVLVPLMVVSLVYFIIPAIQRTFGRFIATGRR